MTAANSTGTKTEACSLLLLIACRADRPGVCPSRQCAAHTIIDVLHLALRRHHYFDLHAQHSVHCAWVKRCLALDVSAFSAARILDGLPFAPGPVAHQIQSPRWSHMKASQPAGGVPGVSFSLRCVACPYPAARDTSQRPSTLA